MVIFERLVVVDGRVYLHAAEVDAACTVVRGGKTKADIIAYFPVYRNARFVRAEYGNKRRCHIGPLVAKVDACFIVAAEDACEGRIP